MIRLKTLRKDRGLSLKEMGDVLGVSGSSVSLYENEKREASYSVLHKASDYFGVSIDYLLEDDSLETSACYSVCVPQLQSVTVSKDRVDYFYAPQKAAIDLGNPNEYLYFKMHDDSMQPQIANGDMVLIRRQSEIESGGIAAVLFENSPVTLRRVIREGETTVLQPFNPNFPSTFIKKDDHLLILGKVVESVRKW